MGQIAIPASAKGTSTITEITPTNIVSGNNYSFTLENVKVGSTIALYMCLNTSDMTITIGDATFVGADVLENDSGRTAHDKFYMLKATSSTITVSGHKANTVTFIFHCYQIG